MAAPTYTPGTAGNALSSQSLSAGASVSYTLNLTAIHEGIMRVTATAGTVAATSGLQVNIYEGVDSTPDYSATAQYSFVISSTSSTTNSNMIRIPTGNYKITLTNLDATNGLTAVQSTIDSIVY